MNILFVRASIEHKLGGPVQGIRNLMERLIVLGHQCEMLTLDPVNSREVLDFPAPITALGAGWGKYRYNPKLIPWLCSNAHRFDAVVVSGIWQFPSLAVWMVSRKLSVRYFVFTHGMLDPWFKNAYPLKHIKKWLYWPWAEYRVLRDARAVFFTSKEEQILARRSFWLYQANERVVRYGSPSPEGNAERLRSGFLETHPSLKGKRLILFMSRIHPKKGCDLLIDAFAQIIHANPNVHLVMAGPDQEGWQVGLMQQAHRLHVEGHITWTGMLVGDIKWGAFHAADVFILPSHSENFGLVVVESLSCNLPVLITNKINIWRDIAEDGAGLVAPDTHEGISSLLSNWFSMPANQRQEMRSHARACFTRRYNIIITADDFIQALLYETDTGYQHYTANDRYGSFPKTG